jgi:hypothetical protein
MIHAISLLAVAAMQPAPPDWRELSTNAERRLSWDASGVTRDGETTTVRLRVDTIPAPQGANSYAISRVEIRCAAGLVRVAETVNYASDGTAGQRDLSETRFDPIPAESIINLVRRQVCAPAAVAR